MRGAAEAAPGACFLSLTTGKALGGQATGNSGKYATKVEDGVIYVNPHPVTPRSIR